MNNYFRITAYNKNENISIIMDSYGRFEKLWQFSSYLISKGFTIIEVGSTDIFTDGNFKKVDYDKAHVILRAAHYGEPLIETVENRKQITLSDRSYAAIKKHPTWSVGCTEALWAKTVMKYFNSRKRLISI